MERHHAAAPPRHHRRYRCRDPVNGNVGVRLRNGGGMSAVDVGRQRKPGSAPRNLVLLAQRIGETGDRVHGGGVAGECASALVHPPPTTCP